jgi:hypothetical protein
MTAPLARALAAWRSALLSGAASGSGRRCCAGAGATTKIGAAASTTGAASLSTSAAPRHGGDASDEGKET